MATGQASGGSPEPLLSLTGISKQFPGVKALDSVDFDLFPGEVHALMGENGAGKSTLINIISGLLHPTAGKICLAGHEVAFASSMQAQKAGISTITQEFNLVPQLTVAENIFLGREPTRRIGLMDWREIKRRASEILRELGLNVPLGQRVSYLSVGDRQLVEIAKALSLQFRIITMDEPTAALNATEVARLFAIIEKLKQRRVAVLYVSHRLGEIFRIADRVTVLRDGKRVDTRPVEGLTENDVVTMMLGRALKKEALIYQASPAAGKVALSIKSLSVPGFLSDISFDLRVGEVMGCAGLIGSGRYELTRTLFGLLRASGGTVEINGQILRVATPGDAIRRGIYMLPEERKVEGILPDLTVRENLLISAKRLFHRLSELLIDAKEEQNQYERMRKSLDIRASSSSQRITKLSGGNQQKVMLGRALTSESRILLLNEPTRGVDVGTRVEIHAAIRKLAEQGYAVIVSSTDIPELVSVSDRCLVLSRGRMNGLLDRTQINEDNITALGNRPADYGRQPMSNFRRLPSVRTIFELSHATRLVQVAGSLGVFVLLVIVVVGASILAPGFFTYTNLTNTLITASITAVTGLGMTFAIAMGGFDLSVGSIQVLTAIVAAGLLSIVDPALAILGALLTGLAIGLLNGILISKLRLPAFVVTFGMMSVVRGVALLVTQGQSVMITKHIEFGLLNNGKIFGLPVPFLIMIAVFILLSLLLKHTPFGRHTCAIGGNQSAAVASGINIDRVTISVFGLVGVTAAISGVMLASQLMIVDATLGVGFELQAITVSVLGGTSLSGGHGNLVGTVFAALLLATIASALNILKVIPFYQYLALGVLLIFALAIDTARRAFIAKSLLSRA